MNHDSESGDERSVFRGIGLSIWRRNQGNLLVAVTLLIFMIGAMIIFVQQHRFRPPRFPDERAIKTPKPETNVDLPLPSQAVTVRVIGAADDIGPMMIAICRTEQEFAAEAVARLYRPIPVKDNVATWIVPSEQLPERFAVFAYHDANNDGVFGINRLGIPSERYGYSRQIRWSDAALWPKFEDAVINRPAVGDTLDVSIR